MRSQWYWGLNKNCHFANTKKRLKINMVFISLNDVEHNAKNT